MKTLTLHPHRLHSRNELVATLEREGLQKGDKLDVVISEEDQNNSIALIGLLLVVGFCLYDHFRQALKTKERVADGERILRDMAASTNAAELEREIEQEYGIDIELIQQDTKEDNEQAHWNTLAMQNLAAAYGEDEPDYSDAIILEPNPDYRPS